MCEDINVEVLIRRYETSDAVATAEVFQAAITTTAAAYYDPEQIRAWAAADLDITLWNERRCAAWTVVAELDNHVVGFSDLTATGELNMLFVHPHAGFRGVARRVGAGRAG